jgi:hypothetical protein
MERESKGSRNLESIEKVAAAVRLRTYRIAKDAV